MSSAIRAAGAVVCRPGPGDSLDSAVDIAVVHRPRYDDWSLPKGKLDGGETIPAAAVREVAEETGHTVTLGRYLGQVGYPVTAGQKTVDYFAAQANDGEFTPGDEVDELRWLAPAKARSLLSYDHDRTVLDTFTATPAKVTTMLLVRHGNAGDRNDWHEHDELRPLTKAGMRQAEALRALLPLWGVDHVYSAPLVRCTQTVEQLAGDLGVPIIEEPLLAEEGYGEHEREGTARLLAIAEAGGTPVISSQGGVIPNVIARLALRDGLALDTLDSRKGSMWVLSFAEGRLISTYYLDSALP